MKNKIIAAFAALALLTVGVLPLAACDGGSGSGSGCLLYNEVGKNAYEVCGRVYDGTKDIVVPAKHNGKTVIGVNTTAFYNDTLTESVRFSEGLEYVEDWAFHGCKTIKKVELPNSLKYIGSAAFEYCSELSDITLKDNIEYIGRGAFDGTAYYADTKNWTDGLMYIGKYCVSRGQVFIDTGSVTVKDGTKLVAVNAVSGIREVTYPDSVEIALGTSDRELINSTQTVHLGKGIKRLGQGVVAAGGDETIVDGCYISSGRFNTNIHIGADIRVVAEGANSSYQPIETITVDPANKYYYAEGNCLIEKATKKVVIGGNKSFIPKGVKEIGIGAFSNVTLSDGVIPDGVEKIGTYAFFTARGIHCIIPDSVKEIGFMAFGDRDAVELGKGVEKIGCNAFGVLSKVKAFYSGTVEDFCRIKCTDMVNPVEPHSPIDELYINDELVTKLTVPRGIECLDGICGMSSIEEIELPDSVKTIGYCALGSVKTLRIGKGLKLIWSGPKLSRVTDTYFAGDIADWCCVSVVASPMRYPVFGNLRINGSSVENLVIPEGVKGVSDYVFSGAGVKTISIPQSMKAIAPWAFVGNEVTSVTFAATDGWKYGYTELDPTELSDPGKAAGYFGRAMGFDPDTGELFVPQLLTRA